MAGTRPNFVKAAPLLKAFKALPKHKRPKVWLLHTGQHYDRKLSQVFFEDLDIPTPDICLNIKPQGAAGQTDEILEKFPKVLASKKPDLVMVVGDVTGTLACALAAKMSGIPVAHVEAGLRSYDNTMPEERNRVLTDHVSDLLFTSCPEAKGNLLKEGIDKRKIHFAGNVMIDSLKAELLKAEGRITKGRRQNKLHYEGRKILARLGLQNREGIRPYVLVTLHRPGNVDDPKVLKPMLEAFQKMAQEVPVVFPVHPRTLKNLKTNAKGRNQIPSSKLQIGLNGLRLVPPLGYLDFIALQKNALAVFTDSGGVQEETSFLNVPCFTVRPNTERPVTVSLGTNQIIGTKPEAILKAWGKFKRQKAEGRFIRRSINEGGKQKPVPGMAKVPGKLMDGKRTKRDMGSGQTVNRKSRIPKWDGHAAERIAEAIVSKK